MKIKKYLLFAMAVGMLTACDPIKDEANFDVTTLTADELLAGATFAQYSGVKNDDGTITYTPSETGNYIEFNFPTVSSVDVYAIKKDGSELSLSTGKSGGIVNYVPTRGSDPTQTLYFRYINQDGEEVVASKDFTFTVASDLSAGMKLFCSNNGSKIWTWNPDATGQVWGNTGAPVTATELANGSKWWGCGAVGGECANGDFSGQMQHSATGDTDEIELGAYMVFSEEGTITKYSKDGKQIGSGTFEVDSYTGERDDSNYGSLGTLKISAGAILFPFQINWADKGLDSQPTEFVIAQLTAGELLLMYTDPSVDRTSWGDESTWWSFKSVSDYEGMLTNNDVKEWTWNPDATGQVWGNTGAPVTATEFANGSKWWGCGAVGGECANGDFSGQMQHSATGDTDEIELDAYMSFSTDGVITKYKKDGTVISQGTYEVTDWNNGNRDDNNYGSLGTLKTTAGAILFPFQINWSDKGLEAQPTEFVIAKFTADELMLMYTDPSVDRTSWGDESTWWSFKAR